MGKGTFVFGVSNASSYPLLLELASRCAERGERVAFIYEHGDDDFFRQMSADLRQLGAKALSFEEELNRPPSFPIRMAQTVRKLVVIGAPLPLTKLAAYKNVHGPRIKTAKRLLRKEKQKLLVVAEDGITGNMWLLAAARAMGIPVVDCPYGYGTREAFDNTVMAEKDEAGELIMSTGEEGAKVVELYPQWVKSGRYAGALMFPPEDILARESLGISVQDAWIIHGGFADKICAESMQMLEFYQDEGIAPGRLLLTGSAYGDVMFRALQRDGEARAAFMKPRKISADRTRVLVCWPPSYHPLRADKCKFGSFQELSSEVLGYLAGLPDVEFLVSLHPSVAPEDRQVIMELGVMVVDENIFELLPCCDVYIACFSSTIRWAIAAGKPVVNYDFYGFDLLDFETASGVLTVNTFRAFKDEMSRLCGDDDRYLEVAQRQLDVSDWWGVVDGKRFDSIYDVFLNPTG
jgi:hypothetical protein